MSAAVSAADFDAAGRLTTITHDGKAIPVFAGLAFNLDGGKLLQVAPSRNVKLTRDGDAWHGTIKLPGGTANFEVSWTDIPGKLRFKGKLRATRVLSVDSVDFVIHLPRDLFVGGQLLRVQAEDGGTFRSPIRLTTEGVVEGSIVREKTAGLTFFDARRNWSIGIQLPTPLDVSVEDPPGSRGGATYRVSIRVHDGSLPADTDIPLEFALSIVGKAAPAGPPAAPL
ncbi:MAG: hypothetical protein H7Y89_11310 [Steroidobacteraceae bacterium]|nr:hypothetical protein [Steroidobacteraceae bacterium]